MAVISVTAKEAENQLQDLLLRAEQGEEIIITRDGKPSARLVPLETKSKPSGQRCFGQHRGPVVMSDDFDAELPEVFWLGKES